ncbi:uncharacterized protein LOC133525295 [Cydia pomonella]|uniref:uncharacterized protein LOC133525295 n=1 Tax=Cydia pomonella TaxID=82600 RepID=UPI002ADE2AC7|nr:uncharacterized protein LOC133525295 [Cydia pomonella]
MTVELKWLQILLKIEEIFGFSRRFVTRSIPGKLFVFFRSLIEFSLAIFVIFIIQRIGTINSIVEFILTNTLSFGSMLLSCYYSRTYLRFIGNIQTNNIIFKSDSVYRSNLITSLKLEFYLWSGYFISICVIAVVRINMFYYIDATSTLLVINRVLVNLRFHIELAVITCTLCTMSEQLQSITRSIKKEHANDSVARVTIMKDENDVENLSRNLDQWLFNYSKVQKSSNLFNEIYGIQFSGLNLYYYIYIYIYTFIYKCMKKLWKRSDEDSIQGVYTNFIFKGYSSTLEVVSAVATYVAVILSITIVINFALSAQNLQNNAENLSRCLKQLHLQACLQTGKIISCKTFGSYPHNIFLYKASTTILLENTEQTELLKFLRVILNQPIYIKTFGTVNVNMTLVPACVGLITSYTVVTLQFNNVV